MSHKELIQNFYTAFKNQVNDFSEFCHSDIEWTTLKGMPHGGRYVGLDSVFGEYFPKMLSHFKEFHAIPEECLDFQDNVVVLGRYQGISNNGKNFDVPFSHVYYIEQNKIRRFKQFTDTFEIQESLQ